MIDQGEPPMAVQKVKTDASVVALPIERDGSDRSENNASSKSEGHLKKILSRPWTPKRIQFLAAIVCLAIGIIVTAIVVPIVLTRHRIHDDPSYHKQENAPVLVVNNFPDPGLIHYNGTWFAYGTNPKKNDTHVEHVPVAISTNFLDWTRVEAYDALPTVGAWETERNHWAPDVIQRDDGRFVLYYSGELKDWKQHHCVGVAVSNGTNPLGPYHPQSTPLACPREHGGAIDPSPFRDTDGKLYVTYKADGNSVGHGGDCNNGKKPLVPVPIMLQELASDGVTKVGEPVEILNIDDSDGPLVEAPNIVRTDAGVYYLFFSSHCFTSPKYDVKYAHSTSLKGPYVRAKRALLKSGDFGLTSPGGATVSRDGTKMVFHANCEAKRCMYIAGIDISLDAIITLTTL